MCLFITLRGQRVTDIVHLDQGFLVRNAGFKELYTLSHDKHGSSRRVPLCVQSPKLLKGQTYNQEIFHAVLQQLSGVGISRCSSVLCLFLTSPTNTSSHPGQPVPPPELQRRPAEPQARFRPATHLHPGSHFVLIRQFVCFCSQKLEASG